MLRQDGFSVFLVSKEHKKNTPYRP